MGRGPHLYRRGAVYYWQRRLPNQIARYLRISHVKVNLRTKDIAIARRLVPPLDARAMEVFMRESQHLSREQLASIFKTVLTEHQVKLGLLADIERANPTAERSVLLEDEVAQGIACTLLAQQGANARFPPPEQQKWIESGRDTSFLIKVFEHLERLRDENGIKISHQRLAGHVKKAGSEANAVNLTLAQPIYLRALGAALLAAEERYGDAVQSELDFAALIEEVRNAASDAKIGSTNPVTPSLDHSQVRETLAANVLPGGAMPAHAVATVEAAAVGTQSTIAVVSAALESKRRQDGEWDDKTCRQARFTFTLFDRYLNEVHGLDDFCLVRQPHLAGFDSFLRGLHSNFGKSTRDAERSIRGNPGARGNRSDEARRPPGRHAQPPSNLLGPVDCYARIGQGLAIDPLLSTTAFRARKNKRGRDQRPVPEKAAVEKLFLRPVFIGCAGWDDIDTPGPEFFHRAEFFCSLLATYEGARREEYCGLAVEDVIIDNGNVPYLHIAPNEFRRIKNLQSVRNLALHPEVVRLGFLDYVEAVKALGYRRLFPDLFSPSTKSPLGDRLYDQMLPSLRAVGFTPHQIRHFFGDELKQSEVLKEFRADLLGHGGESETTERYCNPLSIERQMPHLLKLPVLTAHIERRPIRLLPWVVARDIAPWSKAAKAKLGKLNSGRKD